MSLTDNYADHAHGWQKAVTDVGQVWRSTGGREPRQFAVYAERGDISALECPDGVPSTWEASRQVVGAG
jgi:hypothetical protein